LKHGILSEYRNRENVGVDCLPNFNAMESKALKNVGFASFDVPRKTWESRKET
jgi:hypothetical protein